MLVLTLWAHVAVAEPVAEQARADAALKVLQQVRVAHTGGAASAEEVHRWSMRLLEAERAVGKESAARDHLQRMTVLESTVVDLAAHGLVPVVEVDAARFYVAEARALTLAAPATPVPVPSAPTAPVPTAAPTPEVGIEACFQGCDVSWTACTTSADHFRLGVGELANDPECARKAEATCGDARSQTATTCRQAAERDCQAAKRGAACVKDQNQCNARCR